MKKKGKKKVLHQFHSRTRRLVDSNSLARRETIQTISWLAAIRSAGISLNFQVETQPNSAGRNEKQQTFPIASAKIQFPLQFNFQ